MSTAVIVAHADDETLGAGGWIQRLDEVYVDVICRPSKGRQTEVQYKQAMHILGAHTIWQTKQGFSDKPHHDWADQSLHTGWISRIADSLRVGCNRVITHHPGDLNADHRIVAQAVLVACRPPWRGELYAMEIPSSTEWAVPYTFQPNHFVELTAEQVEKKLLAFRCYETEIRDEPHPRGIGSLYNRMCYWGSTIGVQYAEPFQLLRRVI